MEMAAATAVPVQPFTEWQILPVKARPGLAEPAMLAASPADRTFFLLTISVFPALGTHGYK
jgi:hypothetical protein